MNHLSLHGEDAELTSITGTQCPCWDYRGSGYSAQYHRDNSSADDCERTGLIDTTTTTKNIKLTVYPIGAGVWGTNVPDYIKTEIGIMTGIDFVAFGTLDADDNVFLSLAAYGSEDTITYDSNDYRISKIYALTFYELILLSKK